MTNAPPAKIFRTEVTHAGPVTVLTVEGEVDISTVRKFADTARPAAAAAVAGLVVDLSAVQFLSSSAITELVRTFDCLPAGAVMALVATAGVVVRPVQLSGIDRVMSTFSNINAAIAHVTEGTGVPRA